AGHFDRVVDVERFEPLRGVDGTRLHGKSSFDSPRSTPRGLAASSGSHSIPSVAANAAPPTRRRASFWYRRPARAPRNDGAPTHERPSTERHLVRLQAPRLRWPETPSDRRP